MADYLQTVKMKKATMLNLSNSVVIVFALYTFRGAWLAFDQGGYLPWFEIISLWMAKLSVVVGAVFLLIKQKIEKRNILMLCLPIGYWIMQVFHTYGGYKGEWDLSLVSIVVFVCLPAELKKRVFGLFYKMFLIANIISVLLFVCVLFNVDIGIQRELYYFQNEAGGVIYYYLRWFVFAILQNGVSLRLCGVFNEPGALGTLCALLYICSVKRKSKWEKLNLIITGIFTLSLAFFLLMLLYFAVHVVRKKRKNLIYVVVFAVLFLLIPKIDFHNVAINKLAARMAITENGLAGDNRTSLIFDSKYKEFLDGSDVWFGRGSGYVLGGSNSSWKSHYVVPYGVFGTILMLGAWVAMALHCCKKNCDAIIYVFFFMLSLYQRPAAIQNILGYVLILGGIEWMNVQKESKENICQK